jgi:hypothetical protein
MEPGCTNNSRTSPTSSFWQSSSKLLDFEKAV